MAALVPRLLPTLRWASTFLPEEGTFFPEAFGSVLCCEGNDAESLKITASLQPFESKNNGRSVAQV